jgi:hypothetical protein
MANKNDFANRLRAASSRLMQDAEDLAALYAAYFDRGYNAGGTDPIVNADVVDAETTAADITAGITASEQLANYLDAGAVSAADYSASWNRLRRISDL